MSERAGERRGHMRAGARALLCALVALALWVGTLGTQRADGASTARASGRGPCTPLTANDLAEPQVTPHGHASAWLSRTTGTDGTLLSIAGRGWPANAPLAVDGWTDNMGPFLFAGVMAKVTTNASGTFQTAPFRLETGCEMLGFLGGKAQPVTVLLVAHSLDDGTTEVGSIRAPIVFNWLPSPLVSGASPQQYLLEPMQATPHAGDPVRIASTGWSPGDRITFTALVAAWPQYPGDFSFSQPPVTAPTSLGDTTVTADRSGSFSLTYHLPVAAPLSRVLLLLHADDPRFGDVIMSPFETFMLYPTIFPTTLLAERTSLAGGALTVTGDHWLPNQQIDIEYCRGLAYDSYHRYYCNRYASESLDVVWTDSSGHFFAQIHLPANARLGDITVQARLDDASLWQLPDSRPFAAAQPLTIVAPSVTPTYAQLHPRRVWVMAHWPYLAAGVIALLALLGALVVWLLRRRWSGGQARPAA